MRTEQKRGVGCREGAGRGPGVPGTALRVRPGACGSFPRALVQSEQNGTGMHFRFIKKYTLKKALGERYKPQFLVNVFLRPETSRQNAPPPSGARKGIWTVAGMAMGVWPARGPRGPSWARGSVVRSSVGHGRCPLVSASCWRGGQEASLRSFTFQKLQTRTRPDSACSSGPRESGRQGGGA